MRRSFECDLESSAAAALRRLVHDVERASHADQPLLLDSMVCGQEPNARLEI